MLPLPLWERVGERGIAVRRANVAAVRTAPSPLAPLPPGERGTISLRMHRIDFRVHLRH